MSSDPFQEVARDLQRLRQISQSSSANTNEEVRLLRIELNRRDAKEHHLVSLVEFHKKRENTWRTKVEELAQTNESQIFALQQQEEQLMQHQEHQEQQQQQQLATVSSSTEMLDVLKSKWEEVKRHQTELTENRLKLEAEAANLALREQNFQKESALSSAKAMAAAAFVPNVSAGGGGGDEAAVVRRLKKEMFMLRKDHSSTKEELEYLTAEYSDNKMKLERSTTRISSLKEQNDVLRQERHRWLEKANTASFSPTFSSTSLLDNIKRVAAKHPRDRHPFVAEVDSDMEVGKDAARQQWGQKKHLSPRESPRAAKESLPRESLHSSSRGETKRRSGSSSRQQSSRKEEEEQQQEEEERRQEHDIIFMKKEIANIRREYDEKLATSKIKIESEAALALMASENSMREEYRLEVSRYQERERAAREEMTRLGHTVQHLLSKKKRGAKKSTTSRSTNLSTPR